MAEEATSKKAGKSRTLNLIKSLSPEDDDRTSISKRLSWILRHGAKSVGVNLDPDGWISVSDLLKIDILDDVTADRLMAVIVDSNGKKLRYEIKKLPDGTQSVRAYSEKERKAKEEKVPGAPPPEKRAPKPKDKGEKGEEKKPREKKPKEPVEKDKEKSLRTDAPEFVPSQAAPTSKAAPLSPSAAAAATPASMQMAAAAQQAALAAWYSQMYSPMMPWAGWDGSFPGRIKSYNPDKGFGFIDCQYTYTQYNRDVFLHKAQIGDLKVGQMVSFKCEINKQGMPQAKDVSALNLPPQMQAAFAAQGGKGKGKDGKGKGKGKGKDKDKDKAAKPKKEKKEKTKEEGEASAEAETKDTKEAEAPAEAPASTPEAEAPAAAS